MEEDYLEKAVQIIENQVSLANTALELGDFNTATKRYTLANTYISNLLKHSTEQKIFDIRDEIDGKIKLLYTIEEILGG